MLKSSAAGAAIPSEYGTQAGESQSGRESPHTLALVVKADTEHISMLAAETPSGATLTTEEFNRRYAVKDRLRKALVLTASLQRRLGDQRIDVIVADPQTKPQSVHEVARRTGVPL